MYGCAVKMLSLGGRFRSRRAALAAVTATALDVKADLELRHPLVDEVRRAEHRHAVDVAAVEQLARDEAASMVLPMPTSSAMSRRTGSSFSAMSSGTSW